MSEDLDYSWVGEVADEVDEMAKYLSGPMRDGEERVESVDYGLDGMLKSPETFREEEGLLTDAEAVEDITKYISEISLGTITIKGPEHYPSTRYNLDLKANSDETYWEFSAVDADVELSEQNNYIAKLENKIEDKLEDEETGIDRITEGYQSSSEFLEAKANDF